MNYTTIDACTILVHAGSTLDGMISAHPTINRFILQTGDFYLNDKLLVDRERVTIKSESGQATDVNIFQNDPSKDSIVFNYAHRSRLVNLSVHNRHPGRVALTVAGSNLTKVTGCKIYGNSTTFSVYYAGPKNLTEGADTLQAYQDGELDDGNIFNTNVVYSVWAGDSVSFSLQKNGRFENNIIRGGKVAAYMCRDTTIKRNIIFDSTTNGIYLSFPSHNLTISHNRIYECKHSGIKMANQSEHGTFTETDYNIQVLQNNIYDSGIYGMEINHGHAININQNKANSTDIFFIYVLNSTDITIQANVCYDFKVAVWSESSDHVVVDGNTFNSIYPTEGENVVKFVASTNSQISNNVVGGHLVYDYYAIDGASTGISFFGNSRHLYFSYPEERAMCRP